MKREIPRVTSPTRRYLWRGNFRRYRIMFINITGTSLHDFPRRRVGNEMCERERNPKGAAAVARKAIRA